MMARDSSSSSHHDGNVWVSRHLVRQVDIGLAVKQQPHHVEVAVHGGHEETSEPSLHGVL
jgi:hypothetical protein